MASKKSASLAPRKRPRQDRSKVTVETILQAATYILVKRGWAGFTTNGVAERAGVNIASLYQYFPNKEAIVSELQRRHVARARASLPTPVAGTTLREGLRTMIEAGVAEHRIDPALHRVFAEELPLSRRRNRRVPDAAAAWSEVLEPHIKVPDRALANFIVTTAVHAVIHEAAYEEPSLLEHPLLVDELVRLVGPYLAGR